MGRRSRGDRRARSNRSRPCTRPRALDVSQDRVVEKQTLRALGIATAPFRAVDSLADLRRAVDAIGLPAVLKTRRGGYDGKGQAVLRAGRRRARVVASSARSRASSRASSPSTASCRSWPCAAATARSRAGRRSRTITATASSGSRAPAPGLDDALQARAEASIRPLLDELDYVGVCCVELFDVGGELLANEIAPRVHNSGHWTIEGAETSQFENHLRAILGLPLGSTAARGPSAMVNCIGAMPDRDAVLRMPGAHLHDYGKSPRPGRKVGHVTVTAPDADELDDAAHAGASSYATAPVSRSFAMSAAAIPQSASASSVCWPGQGAERCTSPAVRENRGAGAGCGTPSRSMIVWRALMCASLVASLIVSTGA